MTNSEAFVEALAAQKVEVVFGIVGSAFMDALDLFPSAGIRFISVQHEQNSAHMADGYARMSGRHGIVIGQNGPGITNSVTAVAAAYWAHSPVIMITPEAATMTKGYGGFQESDNLKIFESIVKAQCNVVNPARMAEQTSRAFHLAMLENGPVQLNIPRDYFYGDHEFVISEPRSIQRSAGGPEAIQAAFDMLAGAERPALLLGGGSVISGGTAAAAKLAETLGIPAASTYLHNDSFPKSHPCAVGPIGYLGSKAAMWSLRDCDVLLAVGTRLNPFCTNPQYGMKYFPDNAKIVQVDVDQRRLGFTKAVDVEVLGDAKLFLEELQKRVDANPSAIKCLNNKDAGMKQIAAYKAEWKTELDAMTNDTTGVHVPGGGFMRPRQVLKALADAMPEDAVVSTDIGNICSVANGYIMTDHPRHFLGPMSFGNCGYASPAAMGAKVARPDLPCVAFAGEGAWGMQLMDTLTSVRENIPITICVFNNGQWGAEKKNQVLWFGDRYVGTNLESPSFASIAEAMGVVGVKVTNLDEVGPALRAATDRQMKEGKTTVIELMCTKELGDPFRRDAMKLPKRFLDKYKSTEEMEESRTQQPTDTRV
jgi:sulfoacetaldehyde acetyltransferase